MKAVGTRVAVHLTTYVRLPCETCRHDGLCVLADQLREDLPLKLYGGVKPTLMELVCSSYEAGGGEPTIRIGKVRPAVA